MITCQKHLFSLPDDICYLNVAYMSPLLKSVQAAGRDGIETKVRPYELTIDSFFSPPEHLKALFSQVIQAGDKDRIALVPSVSYGIANVANNLKVKPGDRIVLIEEQFPSNVYSWQRKAAETGAELVYIASPKDMQNKGKLWNQAILDAIDERTVLVALPHVHWSEGIVFDLKSIREKTRQHNAWMVIDGTQSVGALAFSVQEFQPEAVIVGGYKWLLGPYSMGLAYYSEAFDNGLPIEDSWMNRLNSEDFSGLVNYQPVYKPKAQRYCVGQYSNFIGVPMQIAALEQVLEWGVDNIQAYCDTISKSAIQQLRERGFELCEDEQRSKHLIGVKLPDHIHPDELKAALQKENVYVSVRGQYLRIAPHLYNTADDFERLLACMSILS